MLQVTPYYCLCFFLLRSKNFWQSVELLAWIFNNCASKSGSSIIVRGSMVAEVTEVVSKQGRETTKNELNRSSFRIVEAFLISEQIFLQICSTRAGFCRFIKVACFVVGWLFCLPLVFVVYHSEPCLFEIISLSTQTSFNFYPVWMKKCFQVANGLL